MGNRVAELKEVGSESTHWIVFQSTGMSCFGPIFGDQLSASIFATALHFVYPNWSDSEQEKLAARVNSFMRARFGETPDEHDEYQGYLDDENAQAVLVQYFRQGLAAGTW